MTVHYVRSTGKRKTAIATAKLFKGSGQIIINGKPYEERFPLLMHRILIEKPFQVTGTMGKYNAEVKVVGGGISAQAGAVGYSIARALLQVNEKFRPQLREAGLLTRDARIKERKKYGLKRARKAPQYTKR